MIRSVNPQTGEQFGPQFDEATREHIDRVVHKAKPVEHILASTTLLTIAGALDAVAEAIQDACDELTEIADLETSLGIDRLSGEVERTTRQLRGFADLVRSGDHLEKVQSELPPGGPARTLGRINTPVGTVAVFAPSNFPFAFGVVGGDTASALAAGCPVIVKAHPGHPQTSQRAGELARHALANSGLPHETLQVVHGHADTARELVAHPGIKAVGFTGSTAAGQAICAVATERPIPIPVFAEQGSLNPVVLAPSALKRDIVAEAEAIAASVTLGSGQFCTKPGLIVLPAGSSSEFFSLLTHFLAKTGPHYLLTRKIRDTFMRLLDGFQSEPGVGVWKGSFQSGGFSVPPAAVLSTGDRVRSCPELREEVFGPMTAVAGVEDLGELEAVLACVGGNLTGTVHGDPSDPWTRQAVSQFATSVGRLVFAGVPTGVAVDPAMHHGGPYPASTSAQYTSVGPSAIRRFLRPVTYQDFPCELQPARLRGL